MIALKPLLVALWVGTSSAFAILEPKLSMGRIGSKPSSSTQALPMTGGVVVDAPPPPELKVRRQTLYRPKHLADREVCVFCRSLLRRVDDRRAFQVVFLWLFVWGCQRHYSRRDRRKLMKAN
jgi:hypothetical protein